MKILIEIDDNDYADIMSDSERNLNHYERLIKKGVPQITGHEDCISRKDAEMCLTANITNMTIEEYISMVGDRLKGLSSIQPTDKENLVVGDCMKREFIEIVVNYPPADLCTYPEYKGKPYYSILYRDEDSRNHVGFGTYKIEMLSQWIKQYFMSDIQPKPKTDVLDKIRAEIEQHEVECMLRLSMNDQTCNRCTADTFKNIYQIIDKYTAEKE